MDFDFRVGFFEGLDAFHWNPVVLVAEVRHHRALRAAGDFVLGRDTTAVIRHSGAQALERAGGAPAQEAAPAETNDADLAAAGLGSVVNRGLNILQHTGAWQRVHRRLVAKTGVHVGLGVTQVHAGLNALERGRGNRQVALGGKTVCDGTDVRVDAKYFLHHHDGRTRLALGLGYISGHLESVGGVEFDELTHDETP